MHPSPSLNLAPHRHEALPTLPLQPHLLSHAMSTPPSTTGRPMRTRSSLLVAAAPLMKSTPAVVVDLETINHSHTPLSCLPTAKPAGDSNQLHLPTPPHTLSLSSLPLSPSLYGMSLCNKRKTTCVKRRRGGRPLSRPSLIPSLFSLSLFPSSPFLSLPVSHRSGATK